MTISSDETMNAAVEPLLETDQYGARAEVFSLPVGEDFLRGLLEDVFCNHWHEVVYGPVIEGAAFEFSCPQKPERVSFFDGYVTVDLGSSHFHLCVGETRGITARPTSPEQSRHRQTSTAVLFRGLDKQGCPVNWGLRLSNGAGEQQCTIFFPNPFLTDERVTAEPDWSKLAMWEDFNRRYLGREPDHRDRSARSFSHT